MQTYDIIVLFILVLTTVRGAKRGFAQQLASIGSLVLGYIVVINFREPVAQLIEAPHPWNRFAAMLGLFMVTALGVWIVFQMISGKMEKAGLKNFDAQMGGLLGLVRGFVVVMAVTMFSVVLLGDAQRTAVLTSFSGYNACRLLQRTHSIVPSEWQEVIQPYMETLEQHQQIVDQLPQDQVPDPLEFSSPSDAPSPYDDPFFGNANANMPSASSDTFRPGDTWRQQPRANLQEPVFVR